MKKKFFHSIFLFVFFVPALLFAQKADSAIGTVMAVKGASTFKDEKTNKWQNVLLQQKVKNGTKLKTGADGFIRVEFVDKNIIELESSSQIELQISKSDASQQIMLFFGKVWNRVQTITSENSKYQVHTTTAIGGVRGTEFTVASGPDASTQIVVSKGKVSMTGDESDHSEMVNPGNATTMDVAGKSETLSVDPQKYDWNSWFQSRQKKLEKDGETIARMLSEKVKTKRGKVEEKLKKQKQLFETLKKLKTKNPFPQEQYERIQSQFDAISREIEDLSYRLKSGIGFFSALESLANSPMGQTIAGKEFIQKEYRAIQKVEQEFNDMMIEGTSMSIEDMDDMLKNSGPGKSNLKDDKGTKDFLNDDFKL